MPKADQLNAVIGKRPWRVSKGIGSFLFFEFGRKSVDARGKTKGTLSIWIEMADWLLDRKGKDVAHSESPDALIEKASSQLQGKKLKAITLVTEIDGEKVLRAAMFSFEAGFTLNVSQYDEGAPGDSIFVLFTPTVTVSYKYDGSLVDENRTPNQSKDPAA